LKKSTISAEKLVDCTQPDMLNSPELAVEIPSSFHSFGGIMSNTSIPATPTNIKSLVGHTPNRRRGVSLFAGWKFIRFREGDKESFPVNPVFDYDCPTFEYNPFCANLEQLENPTYAPFWLPLALSKICTRVLAEAMIDHANEGYVDENEGYVDENEGYVDENEDEENGDHRLTGEGWDNFRAEIMKQCDLTMEQLVIHARVNGFEKGVDYMTQCIYYESGIHAAIEARQSGRPVLRSA
jgi:hypothetical protein